MMHSSTPGPLPEQWRFFYPASEPLSAEKNLPGGSFCAFARRKSKKKRGNISMEKAKGSALVILSAVIFGFTPILAKITFSEGSNSAMLTCLRAAMALPVLLGILLFKRTSLKITGRELGKILILSSVGGTATTVLLYTAYNFISVGMSTTLHFVYPTFVLLICVIVFREPLNPRKITALALSTGGILCFFNGGLSANIAGIAIALVSGLTYAFYMVYMDKSGLKDMHPMKLSFYNSIFVGLFSLIYGYFTHQVSFGLSTKAWVYTFVIAVLVSAGASVFLQMGIKFCGATTAAILSMFEPITSVVLGILILKEDFSWFKLLGCVLILAAVFILTPRKSVMAEE